MEAVYILLCGRELLYLLKAQHAIMLIFTYTQVQRLKPLYYPISITNGDGLMKI